MAAVLDRAGSARSRCALCGITIDKDAVRVVQKPRFAHLQCAIDRERSLAREALLSHDSPAKLVSEVLAEVSKLDPELADEVRTGHRRIQMTRVAPKPLDDPRTQAMLRDIEADPTNRGLYSVLADHLQHLGDERGELIVLDLAEPTDGAALIRRRELAGSLTPVFEKLTARFSWGIGFLRKIELPFDISLAAYREGFSHPSCRLLEVLHLGTSHGLPITIPAGVLPPTLRTLSIAGRLAAGSDLSSLPKLAHLTLMDSEQRITHPALRSIDLAYWLPASMALLEPARLPAVTKLSFDRSNAPQLVDAIEQGGWLAQLTELSMTYVTFTDDDHETLERGLAGRKLAKLAIHPIHDAPLDRVRLQALCDVLDIPGSARPPAELMFVEHAGKPEWGRGRILREFDGKLELEFASGKRTLKDGPYLKRVR